jgi:hypothetical protein
MRSAALLRRFRGRIVLPARSHAADHEAARLAPVRGREAAAAEQPGNPALANQEAPPSAIECASGFSALPVQQPQSYIQKGEKTLAELGAVPSFT